MSVFLLIVCGLFILLIIKNFSFRQSSQFFDPGLYVGDCLSIDQFTFGSNISFSLFLFRFFVQM